MSELNEIISGLKRGRLNEEDMAIVLQALEVLRLTSRVIRKHGWKEISRQQRLQEYVERIVCTTCDGEMLSEEQKMGAKCY